MSKTELTFDDVIEEYRVALGAKKVHVTLWPNATPESLRDALMSQVEKHNEWKSYPETLRLQAEIEQLKARLRRIGRLAQSRYDEFLTEDPKIRELKRAIFAETDIIALHQEEALRFCREKTGK